MNKYLHKLAEFNTNLNYHEIDDPYMDRMLERIQTVNSGNRLLAQYGYKPSIQETSQGEVEAENLERLHHLSKYRPMQGKMTALSLLGGAASGIAAAGVTAAASKAILGKASPAGALASGVAGALLGGVGSYKLGYNDKRRAMDDATQETNNQYLQKALSGYQKVD